MKAVRFHSYGDPDVLVHEDADRPRAGAGQVVLQVAGAASNPVDSSIRAGYVREVFALALPHVPCYDVAGVITEAGEGVSDWSVGDAVVAWLPIAGPGAAAEYAVAPAETLTAAPRTVELADAAALPSVALTAWQALFEHAGLQAGQSVLVNGAGGAVGGYAVQLAAQAGATVTATAGAGSADRIRSYGAQRIIDYTATPLQEAVAGEQFDLVLNLVFLGPQELARLVDLVVDGGAFANTIPPGLTQTGRGVRNLQVFGRSDAGQLAELVARVDAGELKIHVAQRRPLAELRAVQEEFLAGKLTGKTVLIP
ncbi:NADP-dependent oxidoreductase [Streptomyces sp. Qhu-G9]|uniref:NADP-dependent oxidoreductase n=1 Tax=Streptomyces sp. Qhu-G9 TaxID=3452799 RepID=UPI0022AC3394|nr:NADP-dependent oxidoreductase [Streptomyces aurantiacus]WAU82274.1 NADP-dependent oxidoreductase [Streptomyces aurantiacus]